MIEYVLIFRSSTPSERSKMLVESGVLPSSTLSSFPDAVKSSKLTCGVCLEQVSVKNVAALSCNHLFCHSCWKNYVEFMIRDGMNSGM